jgi:putative ATP-dependent endonuclease of OLD family
VFLHGLRIENYRAIRKTSIDLDDSTVLIGENDCGISSVLDALELALGHENVPPALPDYLFHHPAGSEKPSGPIRMQLRFRERQPGEWDAEAYEALSTVFSGCKSNTRALWFEIHFDPAPGGASKPRFSLRSPGCKGKTSDPGLINLLRQLNPVVRVSSGMLTGHGQPSSDKNLKGFQDDLFTPRMGELVERIRKAVHKRLSGRSLDLNADLDDGLAAAYELMEMNALKLGKRESGLSRTVSEIVGWSPSGSSRAGATRLHSPQSAPERLGILLLIGALLRVRPAGIVPEADPLWIIEEPEAHLHPMTLTSVAMFVQLIQRQKIVTTYSGDLLSMIPLRQVRRLVRHDGVLYENRVQQNVLSRSELRRFHYHLRSRFGVASFARLWLLVEGESEYWLIPQIARLMGYEFDLEGIACVEFAQCGLDPPIKVARELGIEWHVLADGDTAGENYGTTARQYLEDRDQGERLTVLKHHDIEHCFWQFGYDRVYKKHSQLNKKKLIELPPAKIIQAAVRNRSKPFLALSIVEAIAMEESAGIPQSLQDMIHACVSLARNSSGRHQAR